MTTFVDRHIKPVISRDINDGFFINILPLDNYIKDDTTEKNMRSLRFWRRALWIKWMTQDAQGEFSYVKTPGTFTLGLEAEWRINERWAVFAEGRNLAGSAIYEWLHYYSDSPEGLLGVKLSF
jgi:hypothetical protein